MLKFFITVLCLVFFSCSSVKKAETTTPVKLTAGEAVFTPKNTEVQGMEKLEDYPAVPLLQGTVSPKNGILYSPRHSAKCSIDSADSKRLVIENKALLQLRSSENSINEKYNAQLESALKKATEKSWWDENKDWVYFGAGALIGVVTSIIIFDEAVSIKKSGE